MFHFIKQNETQIDAVSVGVVPQRLVLCVCSYFPSTINSFCCFKRFIHAFTCNFLLIKLLIWYTQKRTTGIRNIKTMKREKVRIMIIIESQVRRAVESMISFNQNWDLFVFLFLFEVKKELYLRYLNCAHKRKLWIEFLTLYTWHLNINTQK